MYSVNVRALPIGQLKNQIQSSAFLEKIYAATVGLIGLVSLYDAFLVYRYREVIEEQNPFCAWLISLEPECVSLFLVGKGLGTLSVMAILFLLFRHWSRLAVPVAASLMLFQIGLMGYLHGTDGRRPVVTQVAIQPSSAFPALIAPMENKVAPGKVKNIPRKPRMAQSGAMSGGAGRQRLTKPQRRRPRSQRTIGQLQNKQAKSKYSDAKEKKSTRSKERVLNLEDR